MMYTGLKFWYFRSKANRQHSKTTSYTRIFP